MAGWSASIPRRRPTACCVPVLNLYFRFAIPFMGRLIARDQAAYSYLTGSTMDFHTAGDLAGIFREAGFNGVGFRKFMMGTIAVHWGKKP